MAARRSNDFQLVIPERGERVKINAGSTLTVSCHLSPALSAVDMEITWFGEMSCICAYKNREMTQSVGYEGRASLFINDLSRGNVSLRVADFRESDLGVYMCQVTSKFKTEQITVNVAEEVSAISKAQRFVTVDYNKDKRNDITPQDIPSHPNPQDNKLPGDNKTGNKSKQLRQDLYKNESNKSQQGKEVLSNENFQLVVPSKTPEVSLGADLIIPCHLSPEISAVDMEISWSNDTACVCLYKDRKVTEGVLFKDRVSLFTHKLREGNVSLRLKNFRLSDIGNYHCQVISKYRREKISVRVRINPGVQHVSQTPIYEDRYYCQLMQHEDKTRREAAKNLSQASRHDSDKKQHGNNMGNPDIDNFQLVIPQTAQKAQISIGSEIIVPCHLTPEICAIAMQIKWFKETDCVCIYKKGHVIEGRSYKDRASLDTHVLGRGNVSLHLNNFSVSDVGDYYCQVISGDRTQQITVGVRIKPEVQPVSQSPTFQGQSNQIKLFEIDKIWTKQETDKMNESALMAEELHDMLIKACKEKDRQLKRAEQELRETRKMLDRLLRLNPHAQFLDKDKSNPI
ncbi:butyrophilin-like protein 2 isoform X1 [Cyprinus carpio]|uniref:Butyrophilin-like protein 2 isoform X1 n=2 Tax=Cyprinus carpio TaxID=7962 RepID=A0A9Q9XXL6_CYPCA|nr:butyrophilin-like protein 2 isoform X1 [Cyprinus carpio]XP_042609854.1 butyrophilin-like protein 2 isoform X1 [Cyprinus carpio]